MTNRLLGTQVILIGSTQNTTCGTITSVNPNGTSLSDQTYTVPCPSTEELTEAVFLYDDEMERTHDATYSHLIMSIAEVAVIGTTEEGTNNCCVSIN